MSVEQYQRTVNRLDKEIADLEKKKAAYDKKATSVAKRAANVVINKNASESMVKTKIRQIESYNKASQKAALESAELQRKIADKKSKRNDAYQRLQKETERERKKEQETLKQLQKSYERKVAESSITAFPINTVTTSNTTGQKENPEYDVFVSHAWEDKESFVDEFVHELNQRGLKVWYDTERIKWGDSMRMRIDEGLRHSKFGIVVLSPDYIAEGKYWTKVELDGLFQMESINGKMLLPVWHRLTKKQVLDYSPIIASKLAMNTAAMTPDEIAEKFVELIRPDEI